MLLQVISRYSGYGRTGGFRSKRWHGMYTLHNHQPQPRDCSGDVRFDMRFGAAGRVQPLL